MELIFIRFVCHVHRIFLIYLFIYLFSEMSSQSQTVTQRMIMVRNETPAGQV